MEIASLVIGFIFQSDKVFEKAVKLAQLSWGAIESFSGVMPYEHTDYYEKEMGSGLKKKFISFEKAISLDQAPDIKHSTCLIERKLSVDRKREINIDPGYMVPSKFVLLTTKNYQHRIYIGKGIYAETTLMAHKSGFNFYPWTYPDFKSNEYLDYLSEVRTNLLAKLKANRPASRCNIYT